MIKTEAGNCSWILTDSKFLLLFTQKSGVIELVSFLAFFMLAIPLLGFTKRMFTGKEKMFGIMQCLFAAMLGLYCINYITAFIPIAIIKNAKNDTSSITPLFCVNKSKNFESVKIHKPASTTKAPRHIKLSHICLVHALRI